MNRCKISFIDNNVKLVSTESYDVLFDTARNFFKGCKPVKSSRVNGVHTLILSK